MAKRNINDEVTEVTEDIKEEPKKEETKKSSLFSSKEGGTRLS